MGRAGLPLEFPGIRCAPCGLVWFVNATAREANATLKRAHRTVLKRLSTLLTEIDNELKRLIATEAPLEIKRRPLQTITGIGAINSVALTHRFDLRAS